MSAQVKIKQVISGSSFQSSDGIIYVLAGVESPKQGQPYYFQAKDFFRSKLAGYKIRIEEIKTLKEQPKTVLVNAYIGNSFINEQLIKSGYNKVRSNSL